MNSCERCYVSRLPRCGSVSFEVRRDDALAILKVSASSVIATDTRVCVIGAVNLQRAESLALIALDRAESAAGLDGVEGCEEVCGRCGVRGDHGKRE